VKKYVYIIKIVINVSDTSNATTEIKSSSDETQSLGKVTANDIKLVINLVRQDIKIKYRKGNGIIRV